tara:strand:- start:46 stop:1914 length:1869 start_codon:yes stop_codon:yes gene_type:complete
MAEAPNFAVALQEIRQQNNLNRIQQEESDKRQKADDDERIRALGEKIEKASAKETKIKLEADLKLLRAQIAARKEAPTKSDAKKALEENQQGLARLREQIEANGGKAEQNADFLKRSNKIQQEELKLQKSQATSPSQRKEINKDLRKAQIEGLKLALDPVLSPLKSIGGFIERGLGKIVPGFTFGRLVGFVAIVALIKFLRSDMFVNILDALKDLDLKKIGENIKNTVVGLGAALAAIGLTIARATAMLGGAAGIRGAGSLVKDTKLSAKQIGIKQDELIKSKSGQTFKLTKGGDLRQFDTAKGKFVGGAVNQQDLLKKLADEGSLGERGKLLGADAKGNRFLRSVGGVLKRVPFLSQLFAINDLVNILSGTETKEEKIEGLVKILGGLGGGTLGAILGGIVGSFIPVVGNLIGSVGGGIFGYFAGKNSVDSLAKGIAQYAVGAKVTAFDGSIFGVDLNRLLSGGGLGVSDRGTSAGMVGGVSGGKEVVEKLATEGVVEDASITGDPFTTIRTFSARPFSALTGAPTAPGIFGKFIEGIDDNIIFPRRNVNIEAENVNMSGTMLDKFANAFREFLEFGSRNVVVNNTTVRGGDQTMQGGRITANVLSNPDPVIQGITRQALF